MTKIVHVFISSLLFLILISCATEENSSNSSPDYEKTKTMMVDLLKTEEGKKAISDLMKEEEMQGMLIMEHNVVKQTIENTLASETGKEFWQELMKDPEFAKTFAESMQSENEKMLKSLMKDPEYQALMLNILKDPEMEKALLELMKSKEYRQQVMTIMSESFESPFFTAKMNEILTSIADKQMKKQDKDKEEGEEGKDGEMNGNKNKENKES